MEKFAEYWAEKKKLEEYAIEECCSTIEVVAKNLELMALCSDREGSYAAMLKVYSEECLRMAENNRRLKSLTLKLESELALYKIDNRFGGTGS